MEILVSVIAATIKPIGHQLGYLVCYNRNKEELREQLENLETTKRDVNQRVEEAKGKAYTISEEVSKWLADADNAIIHDQLSNSNPSCFNLVQRYQLSRKTQKQVNYILQLMNKRNNFVEIGYRAPLPDTENTIVPGGYQVLESKTSLAKDIKNALAKPEVDKVGVYGMGGVGKTYLLNEVKILVLKGEDRLFDRVIDVGVGRFNDVTQIQEQIGDQLNIELPKSKEGRASFLRNNLAKMEGNILILLDDLWMEYDLIKEIGIPLSKEGCKVLMTSRSQDILTNNMNTQECFQVSSLTEEESWKFFTAIIGDKFETIYKENIAKEVARECGGLPLALDTIAKALKGKDIHHWEDALSKLKNSIGIDIKGVNDKVYASLRLSYDYLDGEETKLLFLLCSVYPDDYKIPMKDLQMYAMGMRLLNKVKTWEDAKNRVMKLVNDLKSSSLLLETDSDSKGKYVKMHDVVRDVAIHIASKEGNMSTLNIGYKLNEWEDEYRSSSHRAIFAHCDNLNNLPQKMKFPDLELLILRVSSWLGENNLQIPHAFFERMENLKVLDLTRMCFLRPLWTTSSLKNLRTLCMLRCEFNDIDTIGELTKLEILRIIKCNMLDHLPPTMSQLTHLKVLEVLHCSKLEVVPTSIFSSMTKLEELKLQDSFCRWGEEVQYKDELIKNVTVSELNYMPHLSNLSLESWNVKLLSEISSESCKKLKEFWICSNESDDFIQPKVSNEYATTLMLNIESQIGSIEGGLEILLQRSERLIISDSKGDFINAIFKPNGNGYPLLKYLWIIDEHGNSEMSHLIGTDFTFLKYLILFGMKRLKNIVPKHVSVSPFKRVKTIAIQFCGQLRNLFSFSIFEGLLDLQEIELINCGMMDGIIFMDKIEDELNICTTSLTSLQLQNVDKLISFCTEGLIQQTSQSVIPFFDHQVSFPGLNDLSIIGGDNLETLWHKNKEPIANSFCKLQSIRIENCTKLRCMFPSNMVTSLASLHTIQIISCASLKRIFETENQSFDDTKVVWSLRELHLLNLPNLKHVWTKDIITFLSFPTLKRVKIHGCTKLTHVWKDNTKVTTSFHSLERIEVEKCKNLKYLLPLSITFLNLNELRVEKCNEMMNLFSSTVVKKLVNLNSIKVSYCKGMSCVVEAKDENDEIIIFKKLSTLELDCLPKMESFYSGKCMLEFPNLESLVIKKCHEMKTFSYGVIMTPRLRSMWIEDTEYGISSTCSVNETIKNFPKREPHPNEEEDCVDSD